MNEDIIQNSKCWLRRMNVLFVRVVLCHDFISTISKLTVAIGKHVAMVKPYPTLSLALMLCTQLQKLSTELAYLCSFLNASKLQLKS